MNTNLIKIIENAITILDIGAEEGKFSLECLDINESVNIYAFESSIIMHQILEKNIKDKGFSSNIRIFNYVIGHKNGIATLSKKDKYINIGGLYIKQEDEVKMITIDSLNLTHCDLININVENEEYILLGAIKTINKLHPCIKFKNEKSIEFLKNQDYQIINNLATYDLIV
jgi:FkbM family methyltransferase